MLLKIIRIIFSINPSQTYFRSHNTAYRSIGGTPLQLFYSHQYCLDGPTFLKSMYPRSTSTNISCTQILLPTSRPSKPWTTLPSTGIVRSRAQAPFQRQGWEWRPSVHRQHKGLSAETGVQKCDPHKRDSLPSSIRRSSGKH